jgi:hypothetical protein
MSLGRTLAWVVVAAVIGGGLYALVAGDDAVPEAAAPSTPARPQIAAPVSGPSAAPLATSSDEATAPLEALSRDAVAAEQKLNEDVERTTREMPPAPPDMGMIDKEGIEKDALEAAKAAGKKP